ncbi:hypothetical protein EYF80_008283 [Liparis tanakae]|uniref:Uncharacterized protein n=1 Tax=Liparis tanakae TaxID=230148 RepID=A0A4Z2IUM0_9TELE|nr:hypothetical protein EYF80_008283 [Liparis tanakae]
MERNFLSGVAKEHISWSFSSLCLSVQKRSGCEESSGFHCEPGAAQLRPVSSTRPSLIIIIIIIIIISTTRSGLHEIGLKRRCEVSRWGLKRGVMNKTDCHSEDAVVAHLFQGTFLFGSHGREMNSQMSDSEANHSNALKEDSPPVATRLPSRPVSQKQTEAACWRGGGRLSWEEEDTAAEEAPCLPDIILHNMKTKIQSGLPQLPEVMELIHIHKTKPKSRSPCSCDAAACLRSGAPPPSTSLAARRVTQPDKLVFSCDGWVAGGWWVVGVLYSAWHWARECKV